MRKIRRRVSASPYSWARIVTPIALALVVASGGVVLSLYHIRKESSQVSNTAQEVDAKSEVLPPNLGNLLPVTTLQELASSAGGSPIADVALENRGGVLIYAVTLQSGTKLGFDAASGDAVVLQDASQSAPREQKTSLPANLTMDTTFEEAHRLAQDAFPNGEISQIRLNTEDDVITFSVRFDDGAEVVINGVNDSVIRVKTPAGASAEALADDSRIPDSSPQSASEPPSDSSENNKEPSAGDEDKDTTRVNQDGPDNSEDAPGKAPIHIEGTLTVADGFYTITTNDAIYTVITDKDISDLVGKVVEVDGKLQSEKTIRSIKIVSRR